MKHYTSVAGLYVHVPFCDGKCDYCAFYSVRYCPDLGDRLLAAAGAELAAARVKADDLRPETLYFGGGTPTVLSADQLDRLCRLVTRGIASDRLKEWTVEVNPGTVTPRKLEVMAGAGVNRISVGAQSFDDAALRRLGRRHSARHIAETVRRLRGAGMENFGLDLIAGVPGVSMARWEADLERALSLGPRHISVYALTTEEGSALSRRVAMGEVTLPDEKSQLVFLDNAERRLTAAGFKRYEISNYALPGFECRHNLSAWRGEEYIGIGPAAASHVGERRWTNSADVESYIRALEGGGPPPRESEQLTPLTKAVELLVFGLRMAEGVDLGAILRRMGLEGSPQAERWAGTLADLEARGLALRRGERWSLTARGRNLADAIAVDLMP